MNRINKLFRGSGRALALVFAASVVWLIFDMAALRFSLNDVNSNKLLKEELIRMERGRFRVLRNRNTALPKATKWAPQLPTKKSKDEWANEVHVRAKDAAQQQKQTLQDIIRSITKAWKGGYQEKQKLPVMQNQTSKVALIKKVHQLPQKVRNESSDDHVLFREKNNVALKSEINEGIRHVSVPVSKGAPEAQTVAKRVHLILGVGDDHVEKKHQPVVNDTRADHPTEAAGSRAPPKGPAAAAHPPKGILTAGALDEDGGKRAAEDRDGGRDRRPPATHLKPNGTKSKPEERAAAQLTSLPRTISHPADGDAKHNVHNITVSVGIAQNFLPKKLVNHSNEISSNLHASQTISKLLLHSPVKGNRSGEGGGIGRETELNLLAVKKKVGEVKLEEWSARGNVSNVQTALVTRDSGMHKVLNLDKTVAPREDTAVGQFGKAGVVPKEKQEEANRRWREGYFNVYLSDQIPVDRAIADTRPARCVDQMVHNDLPTTSIIMCFVDEVWSTLLRSVYSVLNRSPPHLVKEIILVDDFSTKEYLKDHLDKYMSKFPQVHVLHLKERHGLIRARLAGADIATGDVLTFLDSHVECNVGWLEPLLERVRLNRTKVACPVIEVISDKDMSYITIDNFQRGIFNWPMNFGWKPIPAEVIKKENIKEHDPIKCPVMAGGLFSIDRKYFYELGTYDPGLEVWGGENLELSFKVWMCGGEIEIIPCSRVGHIFRSDNPYTFPQDRLKTVERNLARVAEVWLDDYKELFYGHGYHHLLDRNKTVIGDLTKQKELRSKLKCKSFSWYLQNVFPDMQAPIVRSNGLLYNIGLEQCLSIEDSGLVIQKCNANNENQYFNHTWLRLIKQKELCVAPIHEKQTVVLRHCDNADKSLMWLHKALISEPALMDHLALEYVPHSQPICLDINQSENTVKLNICDSSNVYQRWKFMHYYV
ncbi:polypeptide N-acetylgalactosaminyltransferase 5 [Protopterus annectens]|uniref:polypeptide N-acetylgalactosaminyltransferase 5 n=1 Tax=Protopterus annectens TaxID=7888 RepID=UPI001CFB1DDE|nr:polypeptide N-acetylgalactosaminyltransferase 5 [Protopterus annectens]